MVNMNVESVAACSWWLEAQKGPIKEDLRLQFRIPAGSGDVRRLWIADLKCWLFARAHRTLDEGLVLGGRPDEHESWSLLLTLFLPPLSQQKVIHVSQMDREARRLGRSLVQNEEEYDEGDDYDDDLMDLEASNVILTPLLRSDLLSLHDSGFLYVVRLTPCHRSVCSRFRPISVSVAAATPKIRSFQVRPFKSFYLFDICERLQEKQVRPFSSCPFTTVTPCMCTCTQVNVNVLEARKLVGVNINPAVFIRVENQKKNTMTQKSTNCPFYNEVE